MPNEALKKKWRHRIKTNKVIAGTFYSIKTLNK